MESEMLGEFWEIEAIINYYSNFETSWSQQRVYSLYLFL